MGQRLTPEPKTGHTYRFSFDYAYPEEDTASRYGAFVIKAVDWKGQDLLWKSNLIYKNSWQRDTIYFTPKRDVTFLMFTTYDMPRDSIGTAIVLDHFSDVEEIMTLDISAKNTCPGKSIGAVSVNVAHADNTFTYLWQPGNYTTSTVENLPAGVYRVAINGGGMTAEAKVEVKASDLNIWPEITNVSCYGKMDGMVTIVAEGGEQPYRYALNGTYNDMGIFHNMSSGTYDVKATDQLCDVSRKIAMQEPALLQLEKVSTNEVVCSSARNGQIVLSASGGTPPYSYGIPDVMIQSDSILRHLDGGNYHYVIEDNHHCMVEGNAIITKNWRDCAVHAPNAFTPNGDGLNDVFRVRVIDDIHDYRMAVFSRWGTPVFESRNPAAGWNGGQCPAGSYAWIITYTDSKQQFIKQTGNLLLIR
jgi:gliding motility-associated-like protein